MSQRMTGVKLIHGSLTEPAVAPLMQVRVAAARAGVKPATASTILRRWMNARYNINYLSKVKKGGNQNSI